MSHDTAAKPLLPIKRWKDRAFYTGMCLAVIATVYVGFARSYFLRSRYFPTPLAPIGRLHGAIFMSWTVLFLVQTLLVEWRRTDLHRRLGIAGAVLAGAMVVVGTAIAIVSMRHNFASGNERALSFFAIPVGDMLVFPVLVAVAIACRRQPETHKRLMLSCDDQRIRSGCRAVAPGYHGERSRRVLRGDRFVHRGRGCL